MVRGTNSKIKMIFREIYLMKRFFTADFLCLGLCLTLITSCKAPLDDSSSDLEGAQVAGNQLGQLKGLKSISSILASRLMNDLDFSLRSSVYKNRDYAEVEPLLGGFEGVGIKNKFSNGIPNALNMFLWSTILQNFAEEVASTSCQSSFTLNKQASKIIGYCTDSNTSVSKKEKPTWESNPKELWTLVMQEDAPNTEYQVWAQWITSREFNEVYKSSQDRLKAGLSGIVLNPYFLLEN
jgi:hypothetical protein